MIAKITESFVIIYMRQELGICLWWQQSYRLGVVGVQCKERDAFLFLMVSR